MFQNGSIELFRVAGIRVYLHWLWFLVAVYSISERRMQYYEVFYAIAEYLALFLIVLLHEFGHSLACRQVGGRSDQIILWPLGGIAFVDPPRRPGAVLWSIAAGPLVNVALVPVIAGLGALSVAAGWTEISPDLPRFLYHVGLINLGLLVFNILPVYPLDGGQILQAILWFFMGHTRSLLVASGIGLVGVAGLVLFGLYAGMSVIWTAVLGLFLGARCWQSLQYARGRLALERAPRNTAYVCPECGASPLDGVAIKCARCDKTFDPYATAGICPACGAEHPDIRCMDCGAMRPIAAWTRR